jgi:hypothetical protein
MHKMILALFTISLIGCDSSTSANISTNNNQFGKAATSLDSGTCDTLWRDVRYAKICTSFSHKYVEQLSDSTLLVSLNDTDTAGVTSIWYDTLNDDTSYVYRYHLVTYSAASISARFEPYNLDVSNSNMISNSMPNTIPWKITIPSSLDSFVIKQYSAFRMFDRKPGDTFSVKLQRLYCQ